MSSLSLLKHQPGTEIAIKLACLLNWLTCSFVAFLFGSMAVVELKSRQACEAVALTSQV